MTKGSHGVIANCTKQLLLRKPATNLNPNTCYSEYFKVISEVTEVTPIDCPHLADIPIHLITPQMPLWTASDVAQYPFSDPFWAFCWPGGYSISRYIKEFPHIVEGKSVFDFASGCGISSIVALKEGADSAIANDVDYWACAAIQMNSKINGVRIATNSSNLIGFEVEADVVLAGDVCYEEKLAKGVISWLQELKNRGKCVLIGDPGRQFLPENLKQVAEYDLPSSILQENYGHQKGVVWEL